MSNSWLSNKLRSASKSNSKSIHSQGGLTIFSINLEYPQWYPPSLHLQVRAVTADGIGSEVELRPRGGRAFRCRVESLEAPRRLRLRYPGDFIVGTGEWRLDATPGGTRVTWRQTFDTAEHYQRIAAFVAGANEQNLQRLAAEVLSGG